MSIFQRRANRSSKKKSSATIIITEDDDGTLNVKTEFNPPLQRGVKLPRTHMYAIGLIEWMNRQDQEEDDDE